MKISCEHSHCFIGSHYRDCARILNPHQCTCEHTDAPVTLDWYDDLLVHPDSCELVSAFPCTCPEYTTVSDELIISKSQVFNFQTNI